MRLLAAALALTLLPVGAWAGEEAEPISPDRASGSTGAATVGGGVVQLETGLAYSRERVAASPAERRFAVEATLRVGLAEHFELRIDAEPLVRLRGAADATRHGDFGLSAKYRFLDAAEDGWLPALAVLPFVTLPVNEPPIGSGKTDFGAQLIASFILPGQVSLDVNAGMAAIGQTRPGGYLLQAIVAAGVSRDVLDWLTVFTDLSYASRAERDGRDSLTLDAGVMWRPTRDVALDASVVTSLAGAAPDWVVRGGVSIRFGR